MAKKVRRAGATRLPGWYDVYSHGTRAEDHETQAAAVTAVLEDGQMLEYVVVDPELGSQGFALLAQERSARATRWGAFFAGALVVASVLIRPPSTSSSVTPARPSSSCAPDLPGWDA